MKAYDMMGRDVMRSDVVWCQFQSHKVEQALA